MAVIPYAIQYIWLLMFFFFGCMGLRCCVRTFSSCGEQSYSSLGCLGFSLQCLLLLRSLGSRRAGFSSCGMQAYLLCGMWDLPGPGIEPMSPALAGRFLTTGPAGKSWLSFFKKINVFIYLFIYFWLSWVFVAAHRLSLVVVRRATIRCGAWASHCGGFSCCRARALGMRTSVVAARRLSSCGAWA